MSAFRRHAALACLFGILLIPLSVSSLGGLTQIVTCRDQASVPFTLGTSTTGHPLILSAESLVRRSPLGPACAGLSLSMSVGPASVGRVLVVLDFHNATAFSWAGAVALHLGSLQSAVPVGRIGANSTRRTRLLVLVGPASAGTSLSGRLLVGP